MLIAQFSDMHLCASGALMFGHVDTAAALGRCVAHVNGLAPRPDVALITGDLTYDGQDAEYRTLRELLSALAMPYYLIPGNHDHRGRLARAFADLAYLPRDGEFLHYVIEDHPLRLIGLDTIVPGAAGGRMCAARLAWLERVLDARPDVPGVIFMHHPPFATGIEAMDRIGLDGARALAAIVAGHGQIERVLCGHLHRPIQSRWSGTIAQTAPGTAHQVGLDLSPGAQVRMIMEPPAVLLHQWRPGRGMVSHTSYIGDYGAAPAIPDDYAAAS
ncbi:MAG: phosphodiesterase [Alphaproteobacteria bacterium]|nr:phosphodiesterase [Alphaproteobacteria bacterium]